MKRIIFLLTVIFSLTFSATAQADITSALSKINSGCPKSTGPNLTMTSAENTPQGIVLSFEINEQNMAVEALQSQKDMLHDVYVSEIISSSNPAMQALRTFSIKNATPIIFRFAGTITDDKFDIVLKPAELQ